jgi:phosphatidate cytidylyltransferase
LATVLGVIPATLYYLARFGDLTTVAQRYAATVAGTLYAGFLPTFLPLLKRDFGAASGELVVFVLFVTWIADTGAYAAGRAFGQRKLYPAISPGKTWAGAIGGLLGAIGAAAAVKLWRLPELGWVDVAVLAGPGAVLGQLGDLVESMIKRSSGAKDSGGLLPGHGGILDRIDAVLFFAPLVYLYFRLQA